MRIAKDIWKQKNPMFKLAFFVCVFWVIIVFAGRAISPYDPIEQDLAQRFLAPGSSHWFGTDSLGRDVFSRVLCGARISITAGIVTVILAFIIGMFYGAFAAYAGGKIDNIMMRISEMIMAFPPIILAMVIAAALGPSIINSIIAMAIIWWPNYARMMRSLVITVKENDYVTAARVMGAADSRVLLKEIIPNCIGPMVVMATVDIGNAILTFASLSFLGLGTQPPTPEWGTMVSEGMDSFGNWWIAVFPGLSIFIVSIAANFLGDGIRDYLDPKLRKRG